MHRDKRACGCGCGRALVSAGWCGGPGGSPGGESRRAGDAGWPATDSRPPERCDSTTAPNGSLRSTAGLKPRDRAQDELEGGGIGIGDGSEGRIDGEVLVKWSMRKCFVLEELDRRCLSIPRRTSPTTTDGRIPPMKISTDRTNTVHDNAPLHAECQETSICRLLSHAQPSVRSALPHHIIYRSDGLESTRLMRRKISHKSR